MSLKYNLVDGDFQHLILDGTAYDVGKMQGKILKNNKEMRTRIDKSISTFLAQSGFLSSAKSLKKMGFSDFKELQAFFEEYCPGLNEKWKDLLMVLGLNFVISSSTAPPTLFPRIVAKWQCSHL